MKIYEIGTGYTPIPARMGAATEIVVEELTRAFRKQGENVEIIDIAAANRAPSDLPIREVKVPKCFSGTDVQLGLMHKLKRVVYSVALAAELKKILKQAEGKVVLHFHNQYNLFFFLKLTPAHLRKNAMIAYTNHSGIWRLQWEEIKDTIHKRYFQEAECMKKADMVFVLNQETKQNIMEHLGVPECRIQIIANGVNTDVYHPLTGEEKRQAKEKWGFKDCRVILQVGSVYENKGQLRTVEYLLPLLKTNPNLVFAYAGGIVDEAYHQQIRNAAEENGLCDRIRYLGMVSPGRELNELYNTAAATILPSQYEGFSLAAIESCAAGVPVLVDQAGPVCFGDGSIAYDQAHATETIARSVVSCENISDRLGAAARENAVQNYSWEKVASEYFHAFN